MASPFVGQVSTFAFPFAPRFWAFCNGATVPINQYGALFALMGTSFGGNGSTTIGLPNLNSAAACGTGQGPGLTQRMLGQSFGTASVTIDLTTMPMHNHTPQAIEVEREDPITTPSITAGLADPANVNAYSSGGPNATMSPQAISLSANGGQPHNNYQPYVTMNFAIALQGDYPTFD